MRTAPSGRDRTLPNAWETLHHRARGHVLNSRRAMRDGAIARTLSGAAGVEDGGPRPCRRVAAKRAQPRTGFAVRAQVHHVRVEVAFGDKRVPDRGECDSAQRQFCTSPPIISQGSCAVSSAQVCTLFVTATRGLSLCRHTKRVRLPQHSTANAWNPG